MLEDGLCKECLGAQYYDSLTRLCKNCHPDCRRCTGSGKFSCAACSPPLHLDKLNNQCVPCCTGNEKASGQAEECCLCDPETGGCRNSSPAGKRRVPGTEFASADTAISEVYTSYEGTTTDKNDSVTLAITATTTIAVAICLISVALFATIFIVLQAISGRRERKNKGYTQLSVRVEPPDDVYADDTPELMT
ncbi:furin-like protease 2 isoform X1 [Apis mellifera caucasica]|nr:furin-like protease 2 isoform X1 [Apis mellifera caucasica]